ncbi:MAG TPA: CYTH domain-containing protein [Candidatus Saccharimonadales bacterium]|nr:CYTH domain-containing protein [Candidatus Saccharimonadales bacterium]
MGTPEQPQNKTATEIERKFLVGSLPESLGSYAMTRIVQGYVAIEESGTEVRLRHRDGEGHTMTVKSKGGLVRGEHEVPLTSEQFAILWPTTEGRRVEKDRYTIPYGQHTIELDCYVEPPDFVVAEVEFGSVEEAEAFQPPEWFSADVTDAKGFKNQQLATYGVPVGFGPRAETL